MDINHVPVVRERERGETDRQIDRQRQIRIRIRRHRQTDRHTENKTDTTLLYKDTNLSRGRLFYKSVPDDKHRNTQDNKQEYKYLRASRQEGRQADRQTDRDRDRQIETDTDICLL